MLAPSSSSMYRFDRKEHLYTNHFTCSLTDNISLYQYDSVVEEIDRSSGEWKECKNYSRYISIMRSIIINHQLDQNVFVWYDEPKCLYSTSYLSAPQSIYSGNGRNRLNITSLTNQFSTADINAYINGTTKAFPHAAVRIIESLLKKSLEGRIRIVKNKFYFLDEQSTTEDDEFENQYGFRCRRGFTQTLNLFPDTLTLNIQTVSTIFFANISLLEFIHKQIGSNRMPTDQDYEKLTRLLKNCVIVTNQQQYKFIGFDYRRPYELHLKSGELLLDYYRDKENIKLIHTNYPCIQVSFKNDNTKTLFLPLEVCNIEDWRICEKPLFDTEDDRKHIPTPEERYYQIINTLHQCDYNTNLLCQAVGFYINDHEMLNFDAGILTLPTIKIGLRTIVPIDESKIQLVGDICRHKLVSQLAITYFGTNFKQNKTNFERFTDILVNVLEEYNIYQRHEEHIVIPIMEHIDRYFHLMTEQNCDFIICIMESTDEDDLSQLRNNIKTCGTIRYGIMTQCIIYSEIPSEEMTLRNYCNNLIRKINFKNEGINTKVDLDVTLKNRKSENDSYMFLGAVLTPLTNALDQHSSIAALVGSGDHSCSTVAVRVCKQYQNRDIHSIGTIVGMTEMLQQLLDYNCQQNECLPNKIVIYRDKIDDEYFKKIHEFEVPLIRQAFNNVYDDKTKHPLLTIIAVTKRHTTRFFTYNPNGNPWQLEADELREQTGNMSIGCVIDTTVVDPHQHNFYLNSHNAEMGVNHLPLYHVLLNEIGFTDEELQLLTYHLCFTDGRSSTSEAVPSVVHLANVAARNVRDIFPDDKDSSNINVTEQNQPLKNATADGSTYKIVPVHENLRNKPVFV